MREAILHRLSEDGMLYIEDIQDHAELALMRNGQDTLTGVRDLRYTHKD